MLRLYCEAARESSGQLFMKIMKSKERNTMDIYVDLKAKPHGDGSAERPFRRISEAAAAARPGDTVFVSPGVYRENVDPVNSGTEDGRITYVSREPLGAVISGAERIDGWERYEIRSPWVPVVAPGGHDLVRMDNRSIQNFVEDRKNRNIWACLSPRHENYEEQLDILRDQGQRLYLQEFCCDFVETDTTVFDYEDIMAAFEDTGEETLDFDDLEVDTDAEVLEL